MKATKTELIRLARLVRKDIASGRVSKNTQRSLDVLADYQNPRSSFLNLRWRKPRRSNPTSPSLIP